MWLPAFSTTRPVGCALPRKTPKITNIIRIRFIMKFICARQWQKKSKFFERMIWRMEVASIRQKQNVCSKQTRQKNDVSLCFFKGKDTKFRVHSRRIFLTFFLPHRGDLQYHVLKLYCSGIFYNFWCYAPLKFIFYGFIKYYLVIFIIKSWFRGLRTTWRWN